MPKARSGRPMGTPSRFFRERKRRAQPAYAAGYCVLIVRKFGARYITRCERGQRKKCDNAARPVSSPGRAPPSLPTECHPEIRTPEVDVAQLEIAVRVEAVRTNRGGSEQRSRIVGSVADRTDVADISPHAPVVLESHDTGAQVERELVVVDARERRTSKLRLIRTQRDRADSALDEWLNHRARPNRNGAHGVEHVAVHLVFAERNFSDDEVRREVSGEFEADRTLEQIADRRADID